MSERPGCAIGVLAFLWIVVMVALLAVVGWIVLLSLPDVIPL